MNPLFKTLLMIVTCLLLVNCKSIVKEESYLKATSSENLKSTEGNDMPNTNNNLSIPEVSGANGKIAPDSRPPEMSFAKRRSSDEGVIIVESGGMPTLELFNQKDAWELVIGDLGYNWQLLDEDPENCQATYRFYDPIAEIEEDSFFRKLFSLKSKYIDRSGEYLLTCLKLPTKQQIWLQTMDFEAPSSYVVDDLFTVLFDAAVE